ncbi:MAG TPA: hypothetical protein VEV20_14795, partial [Burkholderiales bacterium]|nr:hypothetical protein [Burkholderiales bacterium]
MKSTRVVVLLGLLVVSAGVAGFEYWDHAQRAAQERQARAAQERKRAELAGRMIGSVRVADDYAISRPPNEQHDRILEQVRQAKSQYIVFPPSAPKFRASLDLTARITIAREIASIIEQETGVPVPDPALVFEAYNAPRYIEVGQVQAGLTNAQAQWLIGGAAWHDARGKMGIRLVKIPLKSAVPTAGTAFERGDIPISEELPPEAAFRPLAQDALRGLGFRGDPHAVVKEDAPSDLTLPPSPVAAEMTQRTATEGLWLQQLIGVLHHPLHSADPRPRERVFERTLSGLQGLSPESGDYTVLMARSLLYTGRPFAAAKILEAAPTTPEAKALAAYLKGDLPMLTLAVAEIRREIPRTIAECELISLRERYGELDENDYPAEEKRLAKRIPTAWEPLFALFVAHQNLWTMPAPSDLKPLLDRDFPVEGYRIEDLVR